MSKPVNARKQLLKSEDTILAIPSPGVLVGFPSDWSDVVLGRIVGHRGVDVASCEWSNW